MYMFDLQSALQSADCSTDYSADSDQTCTFQCLNVWAIDQEYHRRGHKSPSGYHSLWPSFPPSFPGVG